MRPLDLHNPAEPLAWLQHACWHVLKLHFSDFPPQATLIPHTSALFGGAGAAHTQTAHTAPRPASTTRRSTPSWRSSRARARRRRPQVMAAPTARQAPRSPPGRPHLCRRPPRARRLLRLPRPRRQPRRSSRRRRSSTCSAWTTCAAPSRSPACHVMAPPAHEGACSAQHLWCSMRLAEVRRLGCCRGTAAPCMARRRQRRQRSSRATMTGRPSWKRLLRLRLPALRRPPLRMKTTGTPSRWVATLSLGLHAWPLSGTRIACHAPRSVMLIAAWKAWDLMYLSGVCRAAQGLTTAVRQHRRMQAARTPLRRACRSLQPGPARSRAPQLPSRRTIPLRRLRPLRSSRRGSSRLQRQRPASRCQPPCRRSLLQTS